MGSMKGFPIVSTHDPEEAEAVMSQELVDLRLESVRRSRDFRLQLNGVHLGDALVTCMHSATDVVVNPGEVRDTVGILVGFDRPSTIYLDGTPVPTATDAPIVAPPRKVRHHYSAGGGFFIFRVGYEALERRLRAVLDRPLGEPLRFETSVARRHPYGRHLGHLADHLAGTADSAPEAFNAPLLRSSFNELVVNTLLAAPSNYSAELATESSPGTAPAIVRRAEEYLAASASEPVTIERLVKECGCSRRALFKAFRDTRGYTPIQFLTDRRLDLAHEALQSAKAGDTVVSVAFSCGFSNPGRFADVYRRRFGTRPSEVLRKRHRSR